MRGRSLRLQLLSGLLVPLALIVAIDVFTAYRSAFEAASVVTDRMLFASARSIGEQLRDENGTIEATIPPAAIEMFASSYADTVYYRVVSPGGTLLLGYADLKGPPRTPVDGAPVAYDGSYRGERLRLVAFAQPLATRTRVSTATVVMGETLRGRDALARTFYLQSATQEVVLVLATFVLTWFVLKLDLRPLLRLGREVSERDPNEFAPVPLDAIHAELRPFVVALNEYMGRLAEQLETRKRFAANAAHQLRTPLTLLRTQAQYALRDAGEREETIQAILATTRQMTRLTDQLLTLARAEAQHRPALAPVESLDLVCVVRDVLEQIAPRAFDHDIDLSFEVELGLELEGGALATRCDPVLAREMVANLLDNAIRYTPRGGSVTASVAAEGAFGLVRVGDTGPGIPLVERAIVFERFYRLGGNESEGSGLGLAIVKEIADAAGGWVEIEDLPPGTPGCSVAIRLPRHQNLNLKALS